jgi:hypothetical protein
MARFGAYEILHELKTGGMGAVLLGRRKGPGSFEQLVAIKTIRPEYAGTAAVRAMFLDEAKILGGINHPGIATVHDFGEEAGTLYMVMEYVAGVSFRGVTELRMPPGVAARAIAEACRGLHAAHEVRDIAGNLQGVVHRDISPDNLMLGFDGHVKVIDFGIALVKNRQSPVTEYGTVKGKPPYMSPEQVKNEALDRRSDVFALGVVLHELLTGELLFDGDSIYAIALKVEQMEIRPPSHVLGRPLPAGLDAVVMGALERDLDRRTPTAAAFAEQLEQVIASAGDETLEAWAERTLAAARDSHRSWIAGIAGKAALATPPIGRPTGSVTAQGPLALVDQLPVIDRGVGDKENPLQPATGERELRPRRSLALPLILGFAVLIAIGAVALFITRSSSSSIDAGVASVDAAPDAAVIALASDVALVAPDALVEPDATPEDAALVADASRVRDGGPRDADQRRAPVDAPPPDAPADVAVQAQGSGTLVVKHKPSRTTFLEVLVDGVAFGKTPILRPRSLAAGAHTVTLVDPTTNTVIHRESITIAADKQTTVVEP